MRSIADRGTITCQPEEVRRRLSTAYRFGFCLANEGDSPGKAASAIRAGSIVSDSEGAQQPDNRVFNIGLMKLTQLRSSRRDIFDRRASYEVFWSGIERARRRRQGFEPSPGRGACSIIKLDRVLECR